ncbi:MAG TPA: fibro-slime domain-containing protein [Labilithrix sp.]|nr:fibro-slime domain-containing protein [Labilithrix sp.]
MRLTVPLAASVVFALSIIAACGTSGSSNFDGGNGSSGGSSGSSGSSGILPTDDDDGGAANDSGAPPGTLEAIIRDFKAYDAQDPETNPDFENVPSNADRPQGAGSPYFGPWTEASSAYFEDANYPIDIVKPDLGADGLPVYNEEASFKETLGRTATTHGKDHFDQWYRDVPGVNVKRKVLLHLTKNENGVYTYDSATSGVPLSSNDARKQFFPIDDGTPHSTLDEGFGNQVYTHNYHFTVELRTKFKYRGNETFKFSGDDDVFVFINKKLVINLGGIHGVLEKEVNLPAMASELGLVVGEEYPLDYFQAERHVVESNLRIETTLDLKPSVVK